ncbi:GNAT family N-acetyltransferase [Oenococcus kitaharae]|uniref:Acetyltransferase n=1 Tax=Oenococcus kitaharae DSM 17330 TaxID=1045004 RepID=G9WJM3_9LACO|nr:GNAT family N-acetyltransferase [Oenococcus kitaharae]EHN59068.1 Acetyltransferase [Oenococcus kitaharae DSM 17330]
METMGIHVATKRLYLREFVASDLDALYEILGDQEVMYFCEPAYSKEKTSRFLQDFCIARQPRAAYACIEKTSNKLIGYILFNEYEKRVYEAGWFFNKRYWRQGYAFEICSALFNYAFAQLKAHKIFAETIDPLKSAGMMRKLGMQLEGIQRLQTHNHEGAFVDLYLYGLLEKE